MMQEAQTYVSCLFKSSLISIHTSVTIEKWTHVHMIFLTGNYVRNKILKNVTGHPVYYFALFSLWKEEQRTSDPEILQ
jgi:ascorbate-specific PTS system EIIC-type component UlaA